MKILYLYRNTMPYHNDDEGSILYSLQELGQEVIAEKEPSWEKHRGSDIDITLFHHWASAMNNATFLPGKKVCWYFDHVDFSKSVPEDEALVNRRKGRLEYMKKMGELCDHVFHTDGDWKCSVSTVLRQGADSRLVDKVKVTEGTRDILYIGSHGGEGRKSFIMMLRALYKNSFQIEFNMFRARLASRIRAYKIVVAPDTPITNNYWSNRVYVMLGFGAFLLHPYCSELAKEYEDGKEIVFYHNRNDLIEKINYYLKAPKDRLRIAEAGLARTKKEHLYIHRVKKLLETVR